MSEKAATATPESNSKGPRNDRPERHEGGKHNDKKMNFNRGNKGGAPSGSNGPRSYRDRIVERLLAIQGPAHDIPISDNQEEKKFSGRCRLYVGGLASDVSQNDVKELVSAFGEVGELFFNEEKKFAFVRMATRAQAEQVRRELDGKVEKGRQLKVRFAPIVSAVKVENLSPFVTCELLHRVFSIFGDIDRCVVYADERGKSKQYGVVEYERKAFALDAVKRCTEGCFFVTASPRPVIVSLMDGGDDEEFTEKMVPRRHPMFMSERNVGPRFAEPGSFEFEYGSKWKALYDLKKQKLDAVQSETEIDERKLEVQMEMARFEHETEQLRRQLQARENEHQQFRSEWSAREQEMVSMREREHQRHESNQQRIRAEMDQMEAKMQQSHRENERFVNLQSNGGRPQQPNAGNNFGPMGSQEGGLSMNNQGRGNMSGDNNAESVMAAAVRQLMNVGQMGQNSPNGPNNRNFMGNVGPGNNYNNVGSGGVFGGNPPNQGGFSFGMFDNNGGSGGGNNSHGNNNFNSPESSPFGRPGTQQRNNINQVLTQLANDGFGASPNSGGNPRSGYHSHNSGGGAPPLMTQDSGNGQALFQSRFGGRSGNGNGSPGGPVQQKRRRF